MAVFDPGEQRMCVRVVYDGAAGAGKTTNLRQLGSLFAAQRTTEVSSPAELRGRTLYFDWMQIAAGVVCGFPLICQVISVPGQVAFTERRRVLLSSADVVVYVCDSTRRGAERARDALRVIDEIGRAAGVIPPVVLQANKQDQLDALAGKALVAAIGRPDLLTTEAIATEGIGVVDTFVSAVRTIARTLQGRMERDGLRIPVRPAPVMQQVLAQVASAPIDPFGAAELLLEEASAALLFAGPGELGPGLDVLEPRARDEEGPVASSGETRSNALAAPLPNADVPTGFIWPAHTGRATLKKLARGGGLAEDVSVGPGGIVHIVEDHVMSTSPGARFSEPEAARQALVRAARERTQLGPLLVNDTVLVVQPAVDGASWLWTVTPMIGAVDRWLDAEDIRTRLEALADAVVQAVLVSHRNEITFNATLGAFGVQQGNVRYVGALEGGTRSGACLVHALASDLAAKGHDVEVFASAVERALVRRLEPTELASIAREEVPDTGSQIARALLLEALERIGSRTEAA